MAETQQQEPGGRTVSAYIPVSLADALEQRAKEQDRTLSQVIKRTLRTALQADGLRL